MGNHNRQISSIGERIKEIRAKRSQTEFASILRTIKQTISKYEKGKILPGSVLLRLLHTREHININWLLTGEGPKYKYSEPMMETFRAWCKRNLPFLSSGEDFYIYGMFVEQYGMERTKCILKEMTTKISTVEKSR